LRLAASCALDGDCELMQPPKSLYSAVTAAKMARSGRNMMAPESNPYEIGLDKNPANYMPLTPIVFLVRSASVYPDRLAVAYGARRYRWREALERCRRLASALGAHGVGRGDTVALMAPNLPEAFEAHFGVPMAGAVLNALNIRLDPETIAFILHHGEAKVLITDTEFSPIIRDALAHLDERPVVIDIVDARGPGGDRLGEMDYEAFLTTSNSHFEAVTLRSARAGRFRP
jgi:fatty-acyl-CoA synthase